MELKMVYDIIEELSNTSSTNEKTKILKQHSSNNLLKDSFRLAYSRNINFNIRKIPEVEQQSESYTLSDAFEFLESVLATRKLTGNAASEALGNVLSKLSTKDKHTVVRVLNRDLDCGVGRSIPNKVWNNLLPEQPQLLAVPYSTKNLKKIKYPAYAQLKADGSRCFAEVVNGEVALLTRAGNEYKGLDNLKAEILEKAKGLGDVTFDGELVYFPKVTPKGLDMIFGSEETDEIEVASREEGNGIVNKSIKGTISVEEADCIVFQVWDLVDYHVTQGTKPAKTPYSDRYNLLKSVITSTSRLELIPTTIVHSEIEAKQVYKSYIAMDLEGIILKNMDGLWIDGRSVDLVKFKEEIDFDLRIIAAYPHSKDDSKLGGVTLESADKKILVNCGSGFKDKDYNTVHGKKVWIPLEDRPELDRRKLWELHKQGDLIGTIVSGISNGALKVKNRETYSLFLPRIKSIRIDKDVPNTFEEVFGITDEEYFK